MSAPQRNSAPRLALAPPRRSSAPPTIPVLPLGVAQQVRAALRPKARLATLVGALLGGFVPAASYVIAHQEASLDSLHGGLATLLVLGGLLFSAKTVFEWGAAAFSDRRKASGFVVLIEGTMVLSHVRALGWTALALLVGINAIATGCTLSLKKNS